MPQNAQTGAAADKWGRETAREIAKKIGAISISESSNEFELAGQIVALHCARQGNDQIGVTYETLKRIDFVIAAFEVDNVTREFQLLLITRMLYGRIPRHSKRKGKVALASKRAIKRLAATQQTIHLSTVK